MRRASADTASSPHRPAPAAVEAGDSALEDVLEAARRSTAAAASRGRHADSPLRAVSTTIVPHAVVPLGLQHTLKPKPPDWRHRRFTASPSGDSVPTSPRTATTAATNFDASARNPTQRAPAAGSDSVGVVVVVQQTNSSRFRVRPPHKFTKNLHAAKQNPPALRDWMRGFRGNPSAIEAMGVAASEIRPGDARYHHVPGKALRRAGVSPDRAAAMRAVPPPPRHASPQPVPSSTASGTDDDDGDKAHAAHKAEPVSAAARDAEVERREAAARYARANARISVAEQLDLGSGTLRLDIAARIELVRKDDDARAALNRRCEDVVVANSARYRKERQRHRTVSPRSTPRPSTARADTYWARQERAADVKFARDVEWLEQKEAVAERSATQLDRLQRQRDDAERARKFAVICVLSRAQSRWWNAVRIERISGAAAGARLGHFTLALNDPGQGSFAEARAMSNPAAAGGRGTSATSAETSPREGRKMPLRLVVVCRAVLALISVRFKAQRRQAAAAVVHGFLMSWRAAPPTFFYLHRFASRVKRLQRGLVACVYAQQTQQAWGMMQLTAAERPKMFAGQPVGIDALRALATQCAAKTATAYGSRLVTTLVQRTPTPFHIKASVLREHFRGRRATKAAQVRRYASQRHEIKRLTLVQSETDATRAVASRDGGLEPRPHFSITVGREELPALLKRCRAKLETELLAAFLKSWEVSHGVQTRLEIGLQFEGFVLGMLSRSASDEAAFWTRYAASASGALAKKRERQFIAATSPKRSREAGFTSHHPFGTDGGHHGGDAAGMGGGLSFEASINPVGRPPPALATAPIATTVSDVKKDPKAIEAEKKVLRAAEEREHLRESWFAIAAASGAASATKQSPRRPGPSLRRPSSAVFAGHRAGSGAPASAGTSHAPSKGALCRQYFRNRCPPQLRWLAVHDEEETKTDAELPANARRP